MTHLTVETKEHVTVTSFGVNIVAYTFHGIATVTSQIINKD